MVVFPVHPPVFRFISVPYYMNISSDGSICHSIVDKDYISSIHVVNIIQQNIKKLLLLPNPDAPIRLETYEMFKSNPAQYEKLARESAEKNAKNRLEDYIHSSLITDDMPEDWGLFPQFRPSRRDHWTFECPEDSDDAI